MKSLSHVRLFATPRTAAYQAPPSMGFSRQEYWSGVPLPFPNWGASLFQLPSNSVIVPVTTEWNLCVDMSISPLSYHHDHLYLICHYIFTLGIYYALMCVCVCVHMCATVSSVHGISQARILEWVACSGFPPAGDLPNPGIEPACLASPALSSRFFTTSATWEDVRLINF